ncbi:DUF4417 domain-containing protein [Clostridium saccharoperbutylacetonicum]|uniref:DUF4417 domain-containing protein n=1 Tax=Clostridium saccharoperbutylacetonicum TaxID=36745 RepID=UPI0039EC6AAF
MKRGKAVVYANSIIKNKSELLKNREIELPKHIPIIPDKLKKEYKTQMVGVHGGDALNINGTNVRKMYKENGFRKTLNVHESCNGLLQFYVKDRTLEGIWKAREKLYAEIKKMGFEAVIAPNFSLYEDAPRIEHLFNIERSITIYNELIKFGINAIPDVAWYNINDLDFWIEQINKSRCSMIAFSFQVVDVRLKASNLWKHYLAGFKYLCQGIKSNIKVIIVGVNSENRIFEIQKSISDNISLHVLNQSAYIQSQRGMYSNGRVRDLNTSKDKLLEMNIKYFDKLYSELI